MKADDLQQVRPGFHDAALGSQAVFRTVLSALSHPGRVIEMPDVSALPRHGHGAAAMLLQALVDSDCAVWLSPSLAHTDAAAWLRFHTGCRVAASPAAARRPIRNTGARPEFANWWRAGWRRSPGRRWMPATG